MQTTPTPQTHPEYFETITIGPHQYQRLKVPPSVGLMEIMDDLIKNFWRDEYKQTRPNELVEGKIDEKKYRVWQQDSTTTPEGAWKRLQQKQLTLLLLPVGTAPVPGSPEFKFLPGTSEAVSATLNFTTWPWEPNTYERVKTPKNGTPSQDSNTEELANPQT